MTKKTIARSRKTNKPKGENAEIMRAAERAGLAPAFRVADEPVFDGDEGVNPKAPTAELVRALFEAPNRTTSGLVADMLLCNADDAALISCAAVNGDGMLSGVIERVAFRMDWRARLAIELSKRWAAEGSGASS